MDWESGNIPEAWKKIKQHLQLIFKAPRKGKSEEEKCVYLLLWVWENGRDVYSAWESTVSADDKKKLVKGYVTPKSNRECARYKFYNKQQDRAESFDHLLTELKLLVKDFNLLIRTYSPAVREKLINKGSDLTLDIAVDIARTHELSHSQLRAMGNKKVEVYDVTPKHSGRANH